MNLSATGKEAVADARGANPEDEIAKRVLAHAISEGPVARLVLARCSVATKSKKQASAKIAASDVPNLIDRQIELLHRARAVVPRLSKDFVGHKEF